MNIILVIHDLIKKYWIILSLLLLLSISILSLWPRLNLQIGISFHDKVFHFFAYSLLAFPVSIAKPKQIYLILIFFVIFGGLIEVVQPLVNRSCDIFDFIANLLGVYFAYLINNKLFS